MCRSFLIVALAQYFVQRCRGLELKTLEIFGFGWIWGFGEIVPAFSRRAFMDHSLISSMVPVPWLRLVRRDAQLEISLPRLWSLDEGARDLGWKVERPNSWHWDRSRLLSVASSWSFGSSIKLCFFDLLGPPFAQAVFVFGCTCVTQAPRCGRTISTSKHLHYMPMSTLNSSTCKLKKELSGTCVSSLNVACWVFGEVFVWLHPNLSVIGCLYKLQALPGILEAADIEVSYWRGIQEAVYFPLKQICYLHDFWNIPAPSTFAR